ncbi:isoprenyl transferase [candidate division WOR-3 bacterium]|nr:isoprenyl transferase [candidate division WOR-3 bacterium]
MKGISLTKYNIDKARLPAHIAIIMDGNGRWAKKRHLPKIEGHKKGIESVRDIVESCGEIGIHYLTLYTFSEENWKRSVLEIRNLMHLLQEHLDKELDELNKDNVRVWFIGRLYKFPLSIRQRIQKMLTTTQNNTGLTLILALSYGGKAEIVDAVQKIINNEIKKINENSFKKYLYAPKLPDPDLLIRTSGEQRISNFLLYQTAYTEIWVTDVLWPDFETPHLLQAIQNYQHRKRKFGK